MNLTGQPLNNLCYLDFCYFQYFQLTVFTKHHNDLNYIDIQVSKKDMVQKHGTHHTISTIICSIIKGISPKSLHRRFGHVLHQRIQHMSKVGIYNSLPKIIFWTYRISFLTKGGPRRCPVQWCPGALATRYSHFSNTLIGSRVLVPHELYQFFISYHTKKLQ